MKCPHCLVSFYDVWASWAHKPQDTYKGSYQDYDGIFQLNSTVCPKCKRLTFKLDRTALGGGGRESSIVYPKGTVRPVSPEVEDEFANDFREACSVIGDSEKASAALSRRCLQNLLCEKAKTKAKNLAAQIQEVIDSGTLPSNLAEAIDSVRLIGNFAAHPIKSQHTGEVIEVEAGEAEWLLDTLEALFRLLLRAAREVKEKKRRAEQEIEGSRQAAVEGGYW